MNKIGVVVIFILFYCTSKHFHICSFQKLNWLNVVLILKKTFLQNAQECFRNVFSKVIILLFFCLYTFLKGLSLSLGKMAK